MSKEQFKKLMIQLYNNNQLFIHSSDNIDDYIDRAFKNAINKGQ
jgi:hypothetical protein